MLKLCRLLIFVCFQILLIIQSTQNLICYLSAGFTSTLFFILMFKDPGNLGSNSISSEQKVQVFTPQGDKQFHFTDRSNKTAAKILQSSLVIYKKKHLNSLKEEESIKEEKQIELQINHNPDQQQQQKSIVPQNTQQQQQQVMYLEQLYCVTCLNDQILRSRHCAQCNICIITYDHHNFLLGKCIGEKNKFIFLLYLLFQSEQLLLTFFQFQVYFAKNELIQLGLRFLLVIKFGYAIILLQYHLYLVLTNQTYAEKRFRHKLNYMKYSKEEINRPFDRGCVTNFKQFIISNFQKSPIKWTFVQQ